MKYNKKTGSLCFLLWIAAIIVSLILEGCHPGRVVTVPEYHEVVTHQHDTLIQRDTIERERKTIVREVDSAAMAELGIRLTSAERAWLVQTDELRREVSQLRQSKTDTVVQHDSIPYPVEVPVIKEVEKPPSRWQRLCMRVGKTVMLLGMLAFGGGVLYLLLRHRFRL